MPIPTNSRRFIVGVALLMLLGAVTDELASHQTSSFVMSTLSDWFGQEIELVAPAPDKIPGAITVATSSHLGGNGEGVGSTSLSLPGFFEDSSGSETVDVPQTTQPAPQNAASTPAASAEMTWPASRNTISAGSFGHPDPSARRRAEYGGFSGVTAARGADAPEERSAAGDSNSSASAAPEPSAGAATVRAVNPLVTSLLSELASGFGSEIESERGLGPSLLGTLNSSDGPLLADDLFDWSTDNASTSYEVFQASPVWRDVLLDSGMLPAVLALASRAVESNPDLLLFVQRDMPTGGPWALDLEVALDGRPSVGLDESSRLAASAVVTPEPASLILLGSGLVGLASWRRARQGRASRRR